MSDIIYRREMGTTIPISIATALALEGLYNRHPDKAPAKSLPAQWGSTLYINVRTLFRNLTGALHSDDVFKVKANQYIEVLINELSHINEFLSLEQHALRVVFYLPTYASLAKEYGNGDLRIPTTDLQLLKHKLEMDVFGGLEEKYKDTEEHLKPINFVDVEIKAIEREKIFVLTHFPVDLLNFSNVNEMRLVESHTGEIKTENQWYQKFHTEKDERIPFNKAMLLFFGDSGGMFKPQHHKSRKRLLEIAHKYKWTSNTTRDRLLLNVQLSGEGNIYQTLQAMFKG